MPERMVRKQIYIDPSQESRLKELSARLGVAESVLIRRGLDMALGGIGLGLWQPHIWERELEFARSLTPTGRTRNWSRDELYER